MSLRIAMLAPIAHSFPPPGYGPWEQVAYDLAEGLVDLGHDVTVFAAGGGQSSGRFVATVVEPLDRSGLDPRLTEDQHIFRTMEAVAESGFDVLHSHLHVHALGYSRFLPCPMVSTLHGSAWNEAHHPILDSYKEQPFVSISDAEREFLPDLNYVATVHNGIDFELFPLRAAKDDFLLFAGRIAPEKAPDLAIEVARRSDHRLLLAGLIEAKHQSYFEAEIQPRLGKGIEYLGEVERSELAQLLGKAAALLMPLRWAEPFGLVVVEAFATGTPVVAWQAGAMPELVRDGVNGFLVAGVEEAEAAVERLADLDPATIRNSARERFSRSAMAAGYAGVYTRLMSAKTDDRGRV
ncbi:MAG TPA: glycosyltransferase family 4 protein [Acidimicrobiia bacterium]|nr:glycosyltransferase family 4 protein [Acidimicrobiia bacterium]